MVVGLLALLRTVDQWADFCRYSMLESLESVCLL